MLVYCHFYSISGTKFLGHEINNRLRNLLNLACQTSLNLPKNSPIVIWKKLLTRGTEKVDGLLCKLSFRLLPHYICILPLLMHFVKHLVTSDFNNTITKGGWGRGKVPRREQLPTLPPSPSPLNETLIRVCCYNTIQDNTIIILYRTTL